MKFTKISVQYIDSLGDDLTVVNAARVSMHKWHTAFNEEKDEKLIAYLAKNGHWSPFSHPMISVRVKAPVFVARQLVKHHVGLSWNEVSRRYVDDEPEFYVPSCRQRADNVKQGSLDTTLPEYETFIKNAYSITLDCYEGLLKAGIAPEVARSVLPVGMMTEWIWTGSLYAFARVVKQRLDSHAQAESRQVAQQLAAILKTRFPISFKHLIEA